jgi:hypothetical protein
LAEKQRIGKFPAGIGIGVDAGCRMPWHERRKKCKRPGADKNKRAKHELWPGRKVLRGPLFVWPRLLRGSALPRCGGGNHATKSDGKAHALWTTKCLPSGASWHPPRHARARSAPRPRPPPLLPPRLGPEEPPPTPLPPPPPPPPYDEGEKKRLDQQLVYCWPKLPL